MSRKTVEFKLVAASQPPRAPGPDIEAWLEPGDDRDNAEINPGVVRSGAARQFREPGEGIPPLVSLTEAWIALAHLHIAAAYSLTRSPPGEAARMQARLAAGQLGTLLLGFGLAAEGCGQAFGAAGRATLRLGRW